MPGRALKATAPIARLPADAARYTCSHCSGDKFQVIVQPGPPDPDSLLFPASLGIIAIQCINCHVGIVVERDRMTGAVVPGRRGA